MLLFWLSWRLLAKLNTVIQGGQANEKVLDRCDTISFSRALLTTESLGQQADILVSTDSLLGTKVKDAQGKDIGKVKKVLIEPTEGKISMVIVSFGGFLKRRRENEKSHWIDFGSSYHSVGV